MRDVMKTLKPLLNVRNTIEEEIIKLYDNNDESVDPSGLILTKLKMLYESTMEYIEPYYGPSLEESLDKPDVQYKELCPKERRINISTK